MCFSTYFTLLYMYCSKYSLLDVANVMGLLTFHFFSFIQMVFLYTVLSILLFCGSLAFAITLILYTRLRENFKLLKKFASYKYKISRYLCLKHFHQNHLFTMQSFLNYSPIFGNLLFAFLLTNYMLNTSMLANIIFHPIRVWVEYFIYIPIILGQFCGFFVVHYVAADHSKQLHRPFKYFMVCSSHRQISLRSKIKYAFFGQSFVTKNRYGIQYGSFGLINMKAFCKVSVDSN